MKNKNKKIRDHQSVVGGSFASGSASETETVSEKAELKFNMNMYAELSASLFLSDA